MAKHVYPPWHSLVQKILFAVAAILCITIPVIYGQRQNISSTTVIVVLLLYFAGWAAFSLGVRFGLRSRTGESSLPVHTPTPAPPVIRHAPASRSALPIAPAIKISSPNSPTPYTTDSMADAADSSTGAIGLETRPQRPGARFVDSHGATVEESNPQETKGAQNTAVVTFQARPRAMTGDSTNSAIYPTYATYRQAQHGNFDAFAQRIRKALESANAENRLQQQRQEQEEQEDMETQQAQSIPDKTISSHDERSEKKLLSALSAAYSRQLMDANETGSIASDTGSLSSLSATKMTGGGRPRSSSTVSIISNLSEMMRTGGTTLFSRTGRSRAGSDASVMIPITAAPVSGVGNASTTSATATATPAIPSSEQSKSPTATTTMAAMASAAAVASAMTIPRSSAYNPDMDPATYNIPNGPAQSQARRTSRHSAIIHPLAKALHVDDNDDDNNSEHDGSPEKPEGGNVSRIEILAADLEHSSH